MCIIIFYLVSEIGRTFFEWFGFHVEEAEKHGIKHILERGPYFSAVAEQNDVSI